MDPVLGLYVLVAAVFLTVVVALLLRWKNGRFAATPSADSPGEAERITAGDLGCELGERATLVQFSSAFCSPCRATKRIVGEVVGLVDGVSSVEIDVAEQLELAERHHIMRTPTVLVLDSSGRVVKRASGLPTRDQVLAAVADAID